MTKIQCVYKIKFLHRFGIQAITLYPFIFFAKSREEISDQLFRHELEHIYQVQRFGWWKFYFLYLKSYFQSRKQGNNHHISYWHIPFEVEARQKAQEPLTRSEWVLLGEDITRVSLK